SSYLANRFFGHLGQTTFRLLYYKVIEENGVFINEIINNQEASKVKTAKPCIEFDIDCSKNRGKFSKYMAPPNENGELIDGFHNYIEFKLTNRNGYVSISLLDLLEMDNKVLKEYKVIFCDADKLLIEDRKKHVFEMYSKW
ncbi:hypothetical protein, partial [Algivirga pacifica]|uniref:hypothetical protein n=1 Tax=Algivirga pacifica TaxID=1162670 RepID=UPI0031ED2E9A